MIESAIQTESLLIPIKEIKKKEARTLGIPEGLPISNALANIYLFDFLLLLYIEKQKSHKINVFGQLIIFT